ncbi:MAG: 16S rRNA (guanine966-N2)-methyltransferase [Thermoproteota archaeon]|jgi:16S rRNA (guanine966-N2)-methyltransferase
MSLKLFGGFAKGFSLQTPKNNSFRPTLTTLRRKFFDRCQDLSGSVFIDLCAGSGAFGLEAISYGADKAIFIEANKKHFSSLKSNLKSFQEKYPQAALEFQCQDCIKWIKQNSKVINSDTILFFDPPYEMLELYQIFFDEISTLEHGFTLLIEADTQKSFPVKDLEKRFDITKIFSQGSSYMALIKT